ncbi:hypothetical protein CRG98_006748 [Punica granatum]|uniref:Uncharacterized protein n=1 Tax=Punica granatum TaxID=22663 RepID=A0A2I0KX26_PUNGR|nr:hypothetical protein CRG98_006748 [Punica granatum]
MPVKVGTTRLSCGVRGRDERPLLTALLAMESVLLGKSLTRVGGFRHKGMNSLKSSDDLWGPVRWYSRLDPFPYSEPLSNLASYFGTRGISDVREINEHARKQTGLSPNPLNMSPAESPSCTDPNVDSRRGPHVRFWISWLGSVYLPGDAERIRLRRSRHLPFYDPKVEGR